LFYKIKGIDIIESIKKSFQPVEEALAVGSSSSSLS
jgi:hypothetical protein